MLSEFDRQGLLRDGGGPARLDGREILAKFARRYESYELNGKIINAEHISAKISAADTLTARRGSVFEYAGIKFGVDHVTTPDEAGFTILTLVKRG